MNAAHGAVERHIEKLAAKRQMILYIDGQLARKKSLTVAQRPKRRQEALEAADGKWHELERRVTDGLRALKHHFSDVTKCLRSAYYWEKDARQAFGEYIEVYG